MLPATRYSQVVETEQRVLGLPALAEEQSHVAQRPESDLNFASCHSHFGTLSEVNSRSASPRRVTNSETRLAKFIRKEHCSTVHSSWQWRTGGGLAGGPLLVEEEESEGGRLVV